MVSSNANSLFGDEKHSRITGLAHKGLWLHLEQSYERIILYRAYAAAIFSRCHPYIWSTTVLHNNMEFSEVSFDNSYFC